MITLIILLILAWSFYIGYSRGLFLQLFYLVGSLVALAIAKVYYQPLAKILYLWIPYANASEGVKINFFKDVDLFLHDHIFYAGVAFLIVYTIIYSIVRLLGVVVHLAPLERFDITLNKIISGLIACFVTSLTISMFLMIVATIPFESVQNSLYGSALARFFVEHFPFISHYLENLWITKIIK